jgi:hypothetical protein
MGRYEQINGIGRMAGHGAWKPAGLEPGQKLVRPPTANPKVFGRYSALASCDDLSRPSLPVIDAFPEGKGIAKKQHATPRLVRFRYDPEMVGASRIGCVKEDARTCHLPGGNVLVLARNKAHVLYALIIEAACGYGSFHVR